MEKAYRVTFPQWKDGRDEYFFTSETDAVNYGEKFKKYGYEVKIDTIYFQQVMEGAI